MLAQYGRVMVDLHGATALQLGELVGKREISARELVQVFAERTDTVGAFVTRTTEQALAHADTLDAQGPGPQTSPLWGVPTAVKDLQATAGVRTTYGSAAYHDHVPDHSDHVVEAMERAGLPSLGKTSTPEFGSPCYTEPEGLPPAVTPWDRTRMAGGSSGGAAAAVAAGLVPVAQGSDGGGSIRIPAACCGIVGLKPTRGRISGAPGYGDVTGLATSGTLARTVRDAAALLDVLAGRQVGDPFWAPDPTGTFLEACDRDPQRLRIARFIEPMVIETDVDPQVRAAWELTSQTLAGLGHEIVDIAPPMSPEEWTAFRPGWQVLTALSPAPEGRENLLRPLTRWLSEAGHAVSGPEFALALGELRRVAARTLAALAPFDAVLTPTLATTPLPVGAIRNDADPAADFEAQCRFTPWTSVWNITGMPAIQLPLHLSAEGLPIGMMLAARPAEEELLLSLAAQVEQTDPWIHRTPPGFPG